MLRIGVVSILLATALIVVICERPRPVRAQVTGLPTHFVQVPPARFMGNTDSRVVTIDDPNSFCRAGGAVVPQGWFIHACNQNNTSWMPNPCRWSHEYYAALLCHELAHNHGWQHEEQ